MPITSRPTDRIHGTIDADTVFLVNAIARLIGKRPAHVLEEALTAWLARPEQQHLIEHHRLKDLTIREEATV